MNKIKNFNIIAYVTYSFVIVIFSFGGKFIDNIILELTYVLNYLIENVNLSNNLAKVIFYSLIYIPYGFVTMIFLASMIDNIKEMLIYSILMPLLLISVCVFISSFFNDISIKDNLIKLIGVLIGEIIVFIYLYKKNIRNCEKSLDNK